MNEVDKNVIDRLIRDKGRLFRIVVDNDSIWVDSKTEEESESYHYHSFEEYGTRFIVQLLKYLGLDADEC